MCVCVMTSRWQRRAIRSLEGTANSDTSCRCGKFIADGWSLLHTGHLWCQRHSFPLAVSATVVMIANPETIAGEPHTLAFHRQHHSATTPPGVCCAGCRTGRPSRPLVATVSLLTRCLDDHINGYGTQQPPTPGMLGHRFNRPGL